MWLCFRWLDLITRIRKLTLPREKQLRHRRRPAPGVPLPLRAHGRRSRRSGFEHVTDAGWDWEEYQQFFRLFYKGDERAQAAVCLVDQQDIAFYYLSISSRGKDGKIWTTWNYPFSYSLKLSPEWRVNRVKGDLSFFGLLESHRQFLTKHAMKAEQLEELSAESDAG